MLRKHRGLETTGATKIWLISSCLQNCDTIYQHKNITVQSIGCLLPVKIVKQGVRVSLPSESTKTPGKMYETVAFKMLDMRWWSIMNSRNGKQTKVSPATAAGTLLQEVSGWGVGNGDTGGTQWPSWIDRMQLRVQKTKGFHTEEKMHRKRIYRDHQKSPLNIHRCIHVKKLPENEERTIEKFRGNTKWSNRARKSASSYHSAWKLCSSQDIRKHTQEDPRSVVKKS